MGSLSDRARRIKRAARTPNGRHTAAQPRDGDAEPLPQTITGTELLKLDVPEPKCVVPGIIVQGLTVLGGGPKLGKSWLCLNTAIGVATGGIVLNRLAVEHGPVLYLALEDTVRRLQDRVMKLVERQPGGGSLDTLHFAREWPRQHQGGLKALEGWLDEHPGTRLVFIDTWQKFRPPKMRNGDAYQEESNHVGDVKALADNRGVAVVLIHHTRKMAAADPFDEINGTMGTTGAADAVLVLKRERGQCDAVLHVTGRDLDERQVALKWDPPSVMWTMLGEADEYRISRERGEVLDLLRIAQRPLGPTEAAGMLEKPVQTVKTMLWRMERDGLLRADGKGKYVPMNSEKPL